MLIDNFDVKFRGGSRYLIKLEVPEECPHCGKYMSPRSYGGVSEFDNLDYQDAVIGLVLQCVLCGKYFIRMFYINHKNFKNFPEEIKLSYNPPIDIDIPEKIKKISKEFPDIYMQAQKAKQANLNQIYGMGLRKALEFLVKDFGIYLYPESTEEIKKQQLGYVIDHYFKDFTDITALFKAATWIGNDETHYERKHPDKDAETINKFISVTMSQISSRLILDEAFDLINNPSMPETKS